MLTFPSFVFKNYFSYNVACVTCSSQLPVERQILKQKVTKKIDTSNNEIKSNKTKHVNAEEASGYYKRNIKDPFKLVQLL